MAAKRSIKVMLRSVTVEPVVLVFMLGQFQTIISFQSLVYRKVCLLEYNETLCDNIENDTFIAEEKLVQASASRWSMYCNIFLTLPAIFVATFMGSWSDKLGRRIPIFITCSGQILQALCHMLNSINMTLPLPFLFIGPLINGFSGGFVIFLMSMYSYVTHISDAKSRTVRFAMIEALVFFAGTVGTFVSGLILDNTSYVFVFSLVAGYTAVILIYAVVFVPRVPIEQTRPKDQSLLAFAFSINHLKESLACIFKRRPGRIRRYLLVQQLLIDVLMMCTLAEMDISYLFMRGSPFHLSNTVFGYIRSLDHFARGIALITILTLMNRVFKTADTTVIILGLASKVVGLSLLGGANARWMLYVAAVLALFQGFPAAGLRSLMSKMVGKEEYGMMFAAVAVGECISGVIATVIVNNTYAETVDVFPGLSYYILVVLICVCLVAIIWMRTSMKKEQFNFDTIFGEKEDEMLDARVHPMEPTTEPQNWSSEHIDDIKHTKTVLYI